VINHALSLSFRFTGGSLKDAVSVCAHELGDIQLALVVARLAQGPGSALEKYVVERFILTRIEDCQNPRAHTRPSKYRDSRTSSRGFDCDLGWARAVAQWILGHKRECL